MKQLWEKIRNRSKEALRSAWATVSHRDSIAMSALCLLSYGCWCAWYPLGFIVPGAIVLILAIVGKLRAD